MDNAIRLLVCEHCGSVEEMPAYSGDPRGDTWLREKEKAHLLPSGTGLHGKTHVARIEQAAWISHRDSIVKQMIAEFATSPGEGDGLGQRFYDTKDNYSLDAMKCWRVDHQRTTNCGDYMSSKMEVKPDTRAERKAEGLNVKDRPSIHICSFCPYHQIVQQRKNKDKFGYDYTK